MSSLATASTISDAGNGLSCLETVISVKLAEQPEVTPDENVALSNESSDKIMEKVKTGLFALGDVMIIVDVSDFARDYLPFIMEGLDNLKTDKKPVVIKWNEYFDGRDIDNVSKGGKSNFVLMLNCLRETLEFSRGKFCVVVICAGNDNMNEAASIFSELDQLRAIIDKQHVDIHCIGIGDQHDVIILDLLARMATGRSTYQTASGGDNIVNRITSLAATINKPSLRVNYRIDGKLYKADVDDLTTSRIFGKFSKDQKIEILLANGEYQKTAEFSPEELCISVNAVDGVMSRKNILRRIKLQLDPICNCLKYEMTENILAEFRNELTAYGVEIKNILAEIKSQIENVDIGELQFITDIITYHDKLTSQYSNQLMTTTDGKGIINVSMENYSRLVSIGFACGGHHSVSVPDKTQCIQYYNTLSRLHSNRSADNTLSRNSNNKQYVVLPETISVDMFEKHKKFPQLFETKVGDALFYYPADQSELTETYINSLLRIMASSNLSESPIYFKDKFYTPEDTRIYDELIKIIDEERGHVDLIIGAIKYVCEWKKCAGVDDVISFEKGAYDRAAQLTFERSLTGEMSSMPGVKLCEHLIALIGVNQKHYSEKLNAVKAARSKITAKNLELQAQSMILNELKSKNIKHIKPQGKRSTGGTVEVSTAPIVSKIASDEMQKYCMNFIGFINSKGNASGDRYQDWFRSHLYERLISFVKLYPDIFPGVEAASVNDLAAHCVNNIIKQYISNEKKKILGENDKADRDEKIKAFVTTDRIYAAAGLLRGAFLGVNLSKYLGTLCEAVADGKIKVPLLAEKLYMIITGRLVLGSNGVALTSPPRSDDKINSILLVEDMPLHVYQKPLGRSNGQYEDLTRSQRVKHINKLAANNTQKPGQWVLGKKKRRLVKSMIGPHTDISFIIDSKN